MRPHTLNANWIFRAANFINFGDAEPEHNHTIQHTVTMNNDLTTEVIPRGEMHEMKKL